MTPEGKQKLRALLLHDESFRPFPYVDTTGHTTIGIGRNLTDRGISQPEAMTLLENDITYFSSKLSHVLPVFEELDEIRQIALINMCFNLGVHGLLKFEHMIHALNMKDYDWAAHEMLNSKWRVQVGERAQRLAEIIRTGEIN